jgi:hypothetical protein
VPAGARNVERRAYIDGTGDVIYQLEVDPENDAYTPALRQRLASRGFRPRPWAWMAPLRPTGVEAGWVIPIGGCLMAVRGPDDPPSPVSRQWSGEWADAAGNVVEYHVGANGRQGRVYATYVPAAVVAEVQAKLAAAASAPPMDPPPGSRRYRSRPCPVRSPPALML